MDQRCAGVGIMEISKIIKVHETIIKHFKESINRGVNLSDTDKEDETREFKHQLEKALNCGTGKKEIKWIQI